MGSIRIALGVEYDGSAFCGWQTQPARCAVQDALESALGAVAGEPIASFCAGRTDAGVHAYGQVIHFDSAARRPMSAWVRATNALLPASVATLWAVPVEDGFHARYSARQRCYRYVLLNHPLRPAVHQGRVGWFHLPLAISPMREAAQYLLGKHDFSAFRSAECQAKSPVREITRLEIRRYGDYLVFDFAANAFLHRMVRNIVGSLIYVGKGKYPPEWIQALLRGGKRQDAAPPLKGAGLYLMSVDYDAQWGIPSTTRSFWLMENEGQDTGDGDQNMRNYAR